MVHHLTPDLSATFADQAAVICETARYMLELKKEQCQEFVNKVTAMAKHAGCQVCLLLDMWSHLHGKLSNQSHTVKPRPEAHMDMIVFEVFLKSIHLIPQQQIYNGTIYIIENVIVQSDLVESSGYSSKSLKRGSCPYAPLDEALQYME